MINSNHCCFRTSSLVVSSAIRQSPMISLEMPLMSFCPSPQVVSILNPMTTTWPTELSHSAVLLVCSVFWPILSFCSILNVTFSHRKSIFLFWFVLISITKTCTKYRSSQNHKTLQLFHVTQTSIDFLLGILIMPIHVLLDSHLAGLLLNSFIGWSDPYGRVYFSQLGVQTLFSSFFTLIYETL